jgi:hypothetical protein
MGIAGLIADLGDSRSGPVLIDYAPSKPAPFFEEALVALGGFNLPAMRAHLQKWIADPEALYLER